MTAPAGTDLHAGGRVLASPRRTARPVEHVTPGVSPLVRAAAYLYVLSIPFEMPNWAIPLEIPTLTGLFLLLATIVQPTRCFRWIPGAVLAFGAYLVAFVAVTILAGPAHRAEITRLFLQIAQLVVMLWVFYNILADERVLRGVLISLVVAGTVRAALQILGIGVTRIAVWGGGERLSVLGQNANLSAMILSAALVALLGLRASGHRTLPRPGPLTWPIGALLVVAIVQTGSRGGLLSALIGIAAISIRGQTLRARIRNTAIAVVALATIGVLTLRSPIMRDRFEGAAAGQLAGREEIYPAAAEMIRERPLLGWGPVHNQFELARRIRYTHRPKRDVHNIVLEVFTTTGLAGALPFLLGMTLCLAGAWRARSGPLGALPIALTAVVLIGTMSGTWIAAKIVWFALGLALAAGAHWRGRYVGPMRGTT